MGELHTAVKYPVIDVYPDSYFSIHMVPPGYNQQERTTADTWHSISRLSPGGWGSIALGGCPPRRVELQWSTHGQEKLIGHGWQLT